MLSRPSSRFVDFGEILKRARPSGNEAKRPSCSAKYRLRVQYTPNQATSRQQRGVTKSRSFFHDVLKPSDPASPRPARNVGAQSFHLQCSRSICWAS